LKSTKNVPGISARDVLFSATAAVETLTSGAALMKARVWLFAVSFLVLFQR
jgi:hypothetical protein